MSGRDFRGRDVPVTLLEDGGQSLSVSGQRGGRPTDCPADFIGRRSTPDYIVSLSAGRRRRK